MRARLIYFNTAKLAKDRGFDIKCYNWYRDTDEKLYGRDGKSGGLIPPVSQGINRYLAPTQALLQKWLREEHHIHVNADIDHTMMWIWSICPLDPSSDLTKTIVSKEVFNSYEEALEQGLRKTLQQI